MIFSYNYLFLLFIPLVYSQFSAQELDNESAQEIANRTYVKEQTELQGFILKKYNRRVRPVRNSSDITEVGIHVILSHISIDQSQQAILLNGHLYMKWKDEFAVWEPSEHNGVRVTMVKQWEVWVPEIKITNSVSGVGQYFEISRRSHVFIQSNGRSYSQMEMYPTFSIKIGCNFDFSAYPFDEQKCAMSMYTSYRMAAVQLKTYYHNTPPTISLGWGSQSTKSHISDWQLLSVSTNSSYFTNGKYTDQRPIEPADIDLSWSILHVWLHLRRNAVCYGVGILLPSLISFILVFFSFLLPSDSAIYILISNLFFLAIFLEDLVIMLPPGIGRAPRIVFFTGFVFVFTTIALALQSWLRYLIKQPGHATGWTLNILKAKQLILKNEDYAWLSSEPSTSSSETASQQTTPKTVSWIEIADCARIIFALVFLLIFTVAIFITLIK